LISLTRKKDIHTHPSTAPDQPFLLSSIMSYDDSAHWLGRAKEMLARAEQMDECVTKQVLRRAADAYESLARTAEQREKRFLPNPVSRTPILPAEARRFAPRKDRLAALQARAPRIDIPSFLKRGPRAEEI
jgi:hypothetical protein